jgi:hypothetical protein
VCDPLVRDRVDANFLGHPLVSLRVHGHQLGPPRHRAGGHLRLPLPGPLLAQRRAKTRGKRWGDPKGIVLDFFGKAELNGVVFDNILEDGLMVSPEQLATWKHVFYGKNNLAAPEKLYWEPQAGK